MTDPDGDNRPDGPPDYVVDGIIDDDDLALVFTFLCLVWPQGVVEDDAGQVRLLCEAVTTTPPATDWIFIYPTDSDRLSWNEHGLSSDNAERILSIYRDRDGDYTLFTAEGSATPVAETIADRLGKSDALRARQTRRRAAKS